MTLATDTDDARPATPDWRQRRAKAFEDVCTALSDTAAYKSNRAVIAQGNSLECLQRLPAASVSLILTDPPYHTTQKQNIYGDRHFKEDEHYLSWLDAYAQEFRRVLRPNGALYLFCSSDMAGRIEVLFRDYLRPLNHITWTKPNDPGFDGWRGKMNKASLRRWYPHSERILFFEQKAERPGHRSVLGQFLRDVRLQAGLSGHELTELTGAYGAVNHGGAVSNWETGRNIPSREQYRRIVEVLEATGNVAELPPYEDVVRPFTMSSELEYTDVWTFPSVRPYTGKHPAEKPLEMLAHIINASTFEGDIVLDCFAGSGATAVATLMSNRLAVGMEIEDRWVKRAVERVAQAEAVAPHTTLSEARSRRRDLEHASLF